MNKIRLIMFLLLVFSTCIAGVRAQPAESQMSETEANEQIAHFKSAKDISQFLDTWYIHANSSEYSSKPVTRFDLVMMIHDYQNKLRDIAAFKLRLKAPEEFYAFVKKNPGYAINYPYSVSGVSAEPGKTVYKDIGRNDDFYFEELDKLGINFCSVAGDCYPDRELTEKEFYEWVGKIYGVRFNNASVSDKPVAREKMGEPLVRAIQTNFERVEKILNQIPKSSQKSEIIKRLPSMGRARISSKSFYLPDSPCADLSAASGDLKKAFEGGGMWGDYRINEGDEGDIVFETGDTCRKGRIILLRVGTAIVTMMEKGIKRIK